MKKSEIVKLVSLLMSSLPCRLPSGVDIKLALEGYAIALEDCERADLEEAVRRCIRGVPEKMKWAPSAPELAQLVRDARARRLDAAKPKPEKVEAPNLPDNPEMAKRTARKISKFLGPMTHDQWVAENIKWGTIKPYEKEA
jgi:hypothetical protein